MTNAKNGVTVSHFALKHAGHDVRSRDLYCFVNIHILILAHLKPDQAKPPSPTAMVRQVTAPAGVSRNAARSMNTV